mmetsp:Transcript_81436/g.216128  ORF Transcript_81436/g.216128 Transcript_81436/m.216128 type:complete len:310 (+) Transcript_81436:77-1006(+)
MELNVGSRTVVVVLGRRKPVRPQVQGAAPRGGQQPLARRLQSLEEGPFILRARAAAAREPQALGAAREEAAVLRGPFLGHEEHLRSCRKEPLQCIEPRLLQHVLKELRRAHLSCGDAAPECTRRRAPGDAARAEREELPEAAGVARGQPIQVRVARVEVGKGLPVAGTDLVATAGCKDCSDQLHVAITGGALHGPTAPTLHQPQGEICANTAEVLRHDDNLLRAVLPQHGNDVPTSVQVCDVAGDAEHAAAIGLRKLLLHPQLFRRQRVINEHGVAVQEHGRQQREAAVASADVHDCDAPAPPTWRSRL